MKTFIFTALISVALATPVTEQKPRHIAILLDDRAQDQNGAYSIRIETENGISVSEAGIPGDEGQNIVQGSYSYPLEDGTLAVVNYVADENGFRVDSPLVPVAPERIHPIPQHALQQIAFAEEQKRLKAQGLLD